MSEAEKYALSVVNGKVPAGKFIKLAAGRFLSDLERKDLKFNIQEAQKAINFFQNHLRHWEDEWRGKSLILEPWQKFVLMQVFGWERKDTKKRRVRSCYVQIARKNAKTTLAAGIADYHLFADRINTPQVLVGANNEDQAKICINTAGRIIEISPTLNDFVEDKTVDLFQYKDNIVNIVHRERNGVIKAMSKEPGTKDGFNPSLGIIDEYHEAKSDKLLNVIESGQGARPEPLLFCITTAGFDKYGPCYSKLRDTSIKILEGSLQDDSHLAFIYEPDDGDAIDSEVTWAKANPNLGVSVFREYLQSRLDKARNEGGSKETDFKTKNLNMWTDAAAVWIQDEAWMQCGFSSDDLEGKECFGGLYTATTESLNCFVLFFPNVNGVNYFKLWSWLPEKFVSKNNDHVSYESWINQGYIVKTPGNSADHRIISKDVIEICQKYTPLVVGFDKTFGQYVAPDVEAAGFLVAEVFQGFNNLAQQTEEFRKMVMTRTLGHFNNPVFRWHVSNTVTHKNSEGQEKPDKGASGSRIGSVSAALNAMAAKFGYYKEGVMTNFVFESMKR